jgi:MYXO-CTERM domain-containing protein
MLGALAANGGPTMTHLPLSGSPAIDAAKALAGVFTDQRGYTRVYDDSGVGNATGGDGSDIGAAEAGGTPLPEMGIVAAASGAPIADGGAHDVSAIEGETANIVFTVENTGAYALTLTGAIAISGEMNCSAAATLAGSPVVAAGSSRSFTVVLTTPNTGPYGFVVTIPNTDPDENPYSFSVSGTVQSGGTPDPGDADPPGCSAGEGSLPPVLWIAALLAVMAPALRRRARA